MNIIELTDVKIDEQNVAKALKVLVDNGVEQDEAPTVLQAIGYVLLDAELEPVLPDETEEAVDGTR